MKIKWKDKKKLIPKVGEVNTGDVLEVSTELGNAFIKQGQAKRYVEKKPKGGEK